MTSNIYDRSGLAVLSTKGYRLGIFRQENTLHRKDSRNSSSGPCFV